MNELRMFLRTPPPLLFSFAVRRDSLLDLSLPPLANLV